MSVDATLRKAAKLAKQGDTARAAQLYQQVLEAFPNNARARQGLTGLARKNERGQLRAPGTGPAANNPDTALVPLMQAFKRGRIEAVLAGTRALAMAHPNHAETLNLLGLAQQRLGQDAEAIESFDRAIAADPALAIAYHNKAASLMTLERFEAAAEAALETVRLAPGFSEGHLSAGFALIKARRIDEAEARFRAVIAKSRNEKARARAWMGRGIIKQIENGFQEASTFYEKAQGLDPNNLEIVNNWAVALDATHDYGRALALLENALARDPRMVSLHGTYARTLLRDNQIEEAVQACKTGLELNPDSIRLLGTLGNCYMTLGDRDGARAAFEKAGALAPGSIIGKIGILKLATPTPDSADYAEALRLAENETTSAMNRVALDFVLFEANDRAGDAERAFSHLERANRTRREIQPYDIDKDRAMFTALKTALPARLPTPAPRPTDAPRPVLVVGMPRSGTSLVEQILANHSAVVAGGEMHTLAVTMRKLGWNIERPGDPLDPAQLSEIAEVYRAELARIGQGAEVVTDKMPLNFRWVGIVLAAMPEARVLFMRRDARATCWSNYRHNFAGGGNRFGNDLADLGHYYRMHHDLMTHWSGMFAERVHTVPYERLTENQEVETRKILAAADLDWEDACLEFHKSGRAVRTASASQVRKKMYKGSSEAWRRYEPFLGPMLEALGDLR